MDEQQAKEFGSFVRERREAAGMSTRELAAMVGVDMSRIVRWELGQVASPRVETVDRLARALNVPPADLMTLAGYPVTKGLPGLRPYMRAKYKDLPPDAVDEVEAFIRNLQAKHGANTGPTDGEDEA